MTSNINKQFLLCGKSVTQLEWLHHDSCLQLCTELFKFQWWWL